MRKAALFAVVTALALMAPSRAEAGWRMDRATAIARAVWHTPCTDRGRIEWVTVQASDGLADLATCTAYLRLPPPNRIILDPEGDWEDMCSLVIHEFGHLAGFRDATNVADPEHSANPRSVMHNPLMHTDARCRDRGRVFLTARGLL